MQPDLEALARRSDELWEESILPSLMDFVAIPALSPGFDPDWAKTGDLDATVELFCDWLDSQPIDGMSYQVHRIGERSPLLLETIERTGPGDVLF